MQHEVPAGGPADEDYEQAVERAGVTELPDTVTPEPSEPLGPPRQSFPDVMTGRLEDDDPPVVAR